jgi:hypothetical protein
MHMVQRLQSLVYHSRTSSHYDCRQMHTAQRLESHEYYSTDELILRVSTDTYGAAAGKSCAFFYDQLILRVSTDGYGAVAVRRWRSF